MTDLVRVLESVVTSPWVYLLVAAVALLDAFFPVVPSETLVITAGAYAASTGEPAAVGVVVAAAIGAFVGDHVSYLIGHRSGGAVERFSAGGRRRREAFGWARRALAVRGAQLLVTARYVPGGRTALTLTMGATRYPLGRFSAADAVAAITWAVYSAGLGVVFGLAVKERPLVAVGLGIALALLVTLVVELVRWRRGRRTSAPEAGPATLVDVAGGR